MKPFPSKIALVGNPNSGKSTLFNHLTGLRQKTGNFPGVTVEKKSGTLRLPEPAPQSSPDDVLTVTEATLIDLPGTYSIYPKSRDEQVVVDILANPTHPDYPSAVIVVADASNLQRNLLLFTQIADLGFPCVLALNMIDVAESMNLRVNAVKLAMRFGVPVVRINARTGEGLDRLREAVLRLEPADGAPKYHFDPAGKNAELIARVKQAFRLDNNYLALQYLCQHGTFTFLEDGQHRQLDAWAAEYAFDKTDHQAYETIARYAGLRPVVDDAVTLKGESREQPAWTRRLDRVLLHPFWGYVSFLGVLLIIFQAVFAWAQYPMDWLDAATAHAIEWTRNALPPGVLNDLLTDGLMAGVGGVIIFIPQIAFLFGLVGLLEESGYMARVMVIMDRLMRKFGLNGRSVVPLISGVACAVPAIMTTRSIHNPYERLLTILVTPLMSCSARLPIYTILIALVVPNETVLGVLNLQGLVLLGLYLLGLVGALFSAWLFSVFVPRREPSYFILEMPTYKLPRWSHLGMTMYDSVRSFVVEAGKIIVAISIVLWVLASYGPGDRMAQAEEQVRRELSGSSSPNTEAAVASARLEASYAGHFGKFIEPAIRPLGYDWKIGIALITSFAAREVFVGTMSTIYSIGGEASEDAVTIRQRLEKERNSETGGPMYTVAVSFSLLMFYVFAMMCMSTLAVVHRETRGWKWPLVQLAYTMALAYGSAWATYQLLS